MTKFDIYLADGFTDGDKSMGTVGHNFINNFNFSIGVFESIVDVRDIIMEISQFAFTIINGIGFTNFDGFEIWVGALNFNNDIADIFADSDKTIGTSIFDIFIKNFDTSIGIFGSPIDKFDIIMKSMQVAHTMRNRISLTNFFSVSTNQNSKKSL